MSYECEDSAELIHHHLDKHFMEPNNHGKILLCKILYFIGGTGLMVERKIDQKMVAVQGFPCMPTLLILSLIPTDCFIFAIFEGLMMVNIYYTVLYQLLGRIPLGQSKPHYCCTTQHSFRKHFQIRSYGTMFSLYDPGMNYISCGVKCCYEEKDYRLV
jgi:hypothetical protein